MGDRWTGPCVEYTDTRSGVARRAPVVTVRDGRLQGAARMATRTKTQLPNPSLLTWARETAGYSIPELARELKRPESELEAWERGDDAPTFAQLARFAERAHRSVAALYLPSVPDEPPLPRDFRVLAGSVPPSFSPEARLAFRRLRRALEDWAELQEAAGRPADVRLPHLHVADGVVGAAASLREGLGVTTREQLACSDEYASMDLWSTALFDSGVLVQKFRVEPAEMRGFSVLHAGLGGVGLSTKDAPAARVFSLLHEVAHLCLREPGVSCDTALRAAAGPSSVARVERFCDALAAESLLPSGDADVAHALAEVAGDFRSRSAALCGRRFGVSRYVVARRLLDLGLVDTDTYWATVDSWASSAAAPPRSAGGDFYLNKLSEVGKPFAAAVLEAVEAGHLPERDAASMLGLTTSERLDGIRARLTGRALR
jgi:Zn-dependent peptidase ImmA (M78 family)